MRKEGGVVVSVCASPSLFKRRSFFFSLANLDGPLFASPRAVSLCLGGQALEVCLVG